MSAEESRTDLSAPAADATSLEHLLPGPGWKIHTIPRKRASKVREDKYWTSPDGKIFRSQKKVREFLRDKTGGDKTGGDQGSCPLLCVTRGRAA